MKSDVTFWLYHGSRVLTSVRMPEGSSDHEVIQHALENEVKCPIGHRPHQTPYEFASELRKATVRL